MTLFHVAVVALFMLGVAWTTAPTRYLSGCRPGSLSDVKVALVARADRDAEEWAWEEIKARRLLTIAVCGGVWVAGIMWIVKGPANRVGENDPDLANGEPGR